MAAGSSQLVGTDPVNILAQASRLLQDSAEYRRRAGLANPYGDGKSGPRIAGLLRARLKISRTAAVLPETRRLRLAPVPDLREPIRWRLVQ